MLNAKPCQSNINDTLEELNNQQNARLSHLIENLLEQQQKLINTLLRSQNQPILNPTFNVSSEFQTLLIDGKIASPIDTVKRRMRLAERYLEKMKYHYNNNMLEQS